MGKAERDGSARNRLAAERARDEARARQRRLLTIVLGVVAAAAVVVVVVAVAMNGKDDKRAGKAAAYDGPLAPVTRQDDGSVLMAHQDVAKPVLEIFEDFQCPICKQVEDASGATVKKLAADKKVRVVYRPMQLFQGAEREPLSSNSHRAANAALCAPAGQWLAYHDTLYANQPEEGDKGFANDDLIAWGTDVGIGDDGFSGCVTGDRKAAELKRMTDYAFQDRKVEGTPTVFLDGRALDIQTQLLDPKGLEKAVLAAG